MKTLMNILITIFVLYSLIVALFYLLQSSFLFYPQPLSQTVQLSETVEEVEIPVNNGQKLHGWLSKSATEHPQKVIIYFGGNAEEVSHLIHATEMFEDWALMLVNYPGYGKSDGRPGEQSFFQAATAIYDYTLSRHDIDPDNIVVMGRSIGTGSAVYLANQRKVNGVILISPFESIRSVAQSKMPFLPVSLILRHKFENKKFAQEIDRPLLAFYSTADQIIPPKHSRKLIEYWKGETTVIPLKDYDHNNIFESWKMWDEILSFLNNL